VLFYTPSKVQSEVDAEDLWGLRLTQYFTHRHNLHTGSYMSRMNIHLGNTSESLFVVFVLPNGPSLDMIKDTIQRTPAYNSMVFRDRILRVSELFCHSSKLLIHVVCTSTIKDCALKCIVVGFQCLSLSSPLSKPPSKMAAVISGQEISANRNIKRATH
jgi:hypothetical protein